MASHFVSGTCQGEKCRICYASQKSTPATHKVEEAIPYDDPQPVRHPLVAYVCCAHFALIVGPASPCVIVAPL